jgi:NADH dehydrogenase FAD-containing subunit
VAEDLSIPEHPEVFVIGDVANFSHQGGKPLPGIAPFAMQSGEHAAHNILERVARRPAKRFKYRDKGSMALKGGLSTAVFVFLARIAGSKIVCVRFFALLDDMPFPLRRTCFHSSTLRRKVAVNRCYTCGNAQD